NAHDRLAYNARHRCGCARDTVNPLASLSRRLDSLLIFPAPRYSMAAINSTRYRSAQQMQEVTVEMHTNDRETDVLRHPAMSRTVAHRYAPSSLRALAAIARDSATADFLAATSNAVDCVDALRSIFCRQRAIARFLH